MKFAVVEPTKMLKHSSSLADLVPYTVEWDPKNPEKYVLWRGNDPPVAFDSWGEALINAIEFDNIAV